MSSTPKISVIIPVAKNESYTKAIKAIRKCDFSKSQIEIIVVKGNQPSVQRNEAVKKARAPIIYFLDNDSIPDKLNFKRIIQFFKTHKDAAVIGGPSLSPASEKGFSYAVGIALGSFWGTAQSSARYSKKGKLRISSELELILCNMAIRKKIFIKAGMFNEKLYPNEENELLNRIKKMKYEIWYDPNLVVFRSHRKTFTQFIKQIFTYGRGRTDQIFVDLKNITLFPLLSLGLDVYLFLLPLVNKIPFITYFTFLLFITLYKMLEYKRFIPYLLIIYFTIHTIYGIGFLYGIITNLFHLKQKQKTIWYKIKRL